MTSPEFSAASIGWNPAADDRLLLAGDGSSLPALRALLASLPPKSRGQVFVEVESSTDVETLEAPGRFAICWLVRERGQNLRRSVDAWLSEMLPVSGLDDHTVHAWIATEGAARTLTSS